MTAEITHPYNDAGDRLRSVRKDRLLINSTYKMAEILGISQGTYSAYETGRIEIGVKILSKLHELYKIMPSYIVVGKGPVVEETVSKQSIATEISQLKSDVLALTAMVNKLSRK